MPTTDEKLDALEKKLDQALRGIALLARHLGAVPSAPGSSSVGSGAIASDAEMAGKYGDPEVRFDPRDWSGESFKRSKFSECPADYLDLLAVVLDGFAEQESDAKKKTYKLRDARLARGWAARKRAGWRPPGEEQHQDEPPPPDEL